MDDGNKLGLAARVVALEKALRAMTDMQASVGEGPMCDQGECEECDTKRQALALLFSPSPAAQAVREVVRAALDDLDDPRHTPSRATVYAQNLRRDFPAIAAGLETDR